MGFLEVTETTARGMDPGGPDRGERKNDHEERGEYSIGLGHASKPHRQPEFIRAVDSEPPMLPAANRQSTRCPDSDAQTWYNAPNQAPPAFSNKFLSTDSLLRSLSHKRADSLHSDQAPLASPILRWPFHSITIGSTIGSGDNVGEEKKKPEQLVQLHLKLHIRSQVLALRTPNAKRQTTPPSP